MQFHPGTYVRLTRDITHRARTQLGNDIRRGVWVLKAGTVGKIMPRETPQLQDAARRGRYLVSIKLATWKEAYCFLIDTEEMRPTSEVPKEVDPPYEVPAPRIIEGGKMTPGWWVVVNTVDSAARAISPEDAIAFEFPTAEMAEQHAEGLASRYDGWYFAVARVASRIGPVAPAPKTEWVR